MRISLVLFPGMLMAHMAMSAEDPRLPLSRDIADRFQKELSGTLMAAMNAGGPVAAIEVCSTQASDMAERFSADSGARVARTALRVRNPDNAADPYEQAVLRDFGHRLLEDGQSPPEHFEASVGGGARYMQAIVMQPLCVTCHGPALSPAIEAAVRRLYPEDEAIGFAPGDLRGAFSIQWPAVTETQP